MKEETKESLKANVPHITEPDMNYFIRKHQYSKGVVIISVREILD